MGAEARQKSVPTASRKKSAPKRPPASKGKPSRAPLKAKPKPTAKPTPKKPVPPTKPAVGGEAAPVLPPRTGDGRRHVLSLSFLRDGDEFYARMESDSGQITELKNRSLDQLLTLVASELEDLLE